MIIAFVQPFMATDVARALHEIPELTGATFTEARGFGRGRSRGEGEAEEIYGTARRVRVEVMIRDELEDTVIRAIVKAARTGNRGDGKIFVGLLTRAIRISPGDEDTAAL